MSRFFALVCVALFIFFIADVVQAAVVTIDGTIKSVDAKKRTITMQTKTKTLEFDVSRKAKINVKSKAAKLDSLKPGQKVKISYHEDLEIVLKIDALSLKEKQPELVVLNELDKEGAENNPWLTSDGLTIYWTVEIAPEQTRWVWTARRKDADSLFENPIRLIPAQDFTISDDELEMIIFQNKELYITSRDTVDKTFVRPKKIAAAVLRNGFLAGPCLSADGLTLYCDGMRKGLGPQIQVMTRKSKTSNWSPPKPLKITPLGRMKFPYVSRNGQYLLCIGRDISQGSNVVIHSRKNANELFSTASIINCEGVTVRGIFPRYVSATDELFIAGQLTDGGELKIMVLKNFSPKTMTRSIK